MKFTTDLKELQVGLFADYQARFGVQTALNINYVPDLLQHIKMQLTSQELIRLEDYHLQNYLMELSIHYKDVRNLAAITNTILAHIRSNNNFWYRHNNQQQLNQQQQLKHNAIVRYHTDIQYLKQAFTQIKNRQFFYPSYIRKTTQIFTFKKLHNSIEPHFGTRQPLNHLAYIPQFLMHKYQNKQKVITHKCQQNNEENLPNNLNISEGIQQIKSQIIQRNLNQIIQECIIFLLSNKTSSTEISIKQPKRQNSQQIYDQPENSDSGNENNKQPLIQKPLLEQFLQFLETQSSLPKFPNSHHMHVLTVNLLQICKNIYESLNKQSIQDNSFKSVKISKPQKIFQSSPLSNCLLDSQFKDIFSFISEKYFLQSQIDVISSYFIQYWKLEYKFIINNLKRKQQQTNNERKGWLTSLQNIQKIKNSYQEMLDHPQFVELTKYRALGTGIPWKQEDYLKFLKGLHEYLNIPTNNKKIASSMGDTFEPNHVKHVKGVYLTVMKQRLDRGQCGGGKRGKSLSKYDFIEKDINNFSMRWFEKAKKIKKRKIKRKRKNSDSQECQQEPDSQY